MIGRARTYLTDSENDRFPENGGRVVTILSMADNTVQWIDPHDPCGPGMPWTGSLRGTDALGPWYRDIDFIPPPPTLDEVAAYLRIRIDRDQETDEIRGSAADHAAVLYELVEYLGAAGFECTTRS